MNKKGNDDIYFNYVDQSEVYRQFYEMNNTDCEELNNHYLEIDQFINQEHENAEENTPLVLEGESGHGKTHLLFNWVKYHQNASRKNCKDIIITHCASSDQDQQASYFYALYYILTQLREKLNMSQKVEIVEEKLRKYFPYWLDISIKKIQEQIVNDANIIIIIDGADQFIDPSGKDTSAKFWLPRFFPLGVKMILTVTKGSLTHSYFQGRNYQMISLQKDQAVLNRMRSAFEAHSDFLHEQTYVDQVTEILQEKINSIIDLNPLFVKTFLSIMLLRKNDKVHRNKVDALYKDMDLARLQNFTNVEQFVLYIVDYFSCRLFDERKFHRLLQVLLLVQKGLTRQELMEISKTNEKEFEIFEFILESFLIRHDGLFSISHPQIKDTLWKYFQGVAPVDAKKVHNEIADCLIKTQTSVRKLEEQIYNLYSAQEYFKLKEIISDIEQFLLLYTSNNKFQLFRYWQKLEEKGFDPSIEYNKALEAFEMHYHPSNEDLFQIIFQMSRFLKDFGDFETIFTPDFRHPPILGKKLELQQIGLYDELEKMNLQDKTREIKEKKKQEKIEREKQAQLAEEAAQEAAEKQASAVKEGKADPAKETQQAQMGSSSQMMHPQNKDVELENGTEIMRLNVDIANNYQVVKHHLIAKMKGECLQVQQFLDNQKREAGVPLNQESLELSGDQDQSLEEIKSVYQKLQQKKLFKNEKLIYKQNIVNEEDLYSHYYYKRFLWMIFPLACISNSSTCDYSVQIQMCQTTPTEYLSVTDEKLHTKKALLLILEAHLKKRQTYEKPEVLQSLIDYLAQFKQDLVHLKQLSIDEHTKDSTPKLRPKQVEVIAQGPPNKSKLSLLQQQKQLENQHHNSLFLTLDDKEHPNGNSLKAKGKFSKLENVQMPDHYSSISIFNKSKVFGQGLPSFRADFSKLNNDSQDGNKLILPRLKQQINSHSMAEIQSLMSKNTYFVKEFNSLKYSNVQREKELANLKIQTNKLSGPKDKDEKKNIQNKIDHHQQTLSKVGFHYKNSHKLKLRMRQIIEICKQNTKQNKVYVRDLNQLLANYQKLINIQKNQIKQSAKELQEQQKLNEELYEICTSRMQNQTQLIQQIKSDLVQKQQFDTKYINADGVIEQSIMQQINDDTQKINHNIQKQKMKARRNMQKNLNDLEDYCVDLETNYETMCEILEVDKEEFAQNQDYKKSDKFKNFIKNQQIINKVKGLNLFKQDECEQLKVRLTQEQYDLDYLIQLQKILNENNDEYDDLKDKSKTDLSSELKRQINLNSMAEAKIQKTKQIKINIEIAYESIYYKLKLISSLKNDFHIQECDVKDISTTLLKKMELIKTQLSEEQLERFLRRDLTDENDILDYLRLR